MPDRMPENGRFLFPCPCCGEAILYAYEHVGPCMIVPYHSIPREDAKVILAGEPRISFPLPTSSEGTFPCPSCHKGLWMEYERGGPLLIADFDSTRGKELEAELGITSLDDFLQGEADDLDDLDDDPDDDELPAPTGYRAGYVLFKIALVAEGSDPRTASELRCTWSDDEENRTGETLCGAPATHGFGGPDRDVIVGIPDWGFTPLCDAHVAAAQRMMRES